MKLCVIFGGEGSEYYVSLKSCASLLGSINKEKYEITKIGITNDGRWYKTEATEEQIANDDWIKNAEKIYIDFENKEFVTEKNERINPDKIFMIMHGDFGENGTLQGLFDLMKIKYVGCDALSSAVGYDKYISKIIAKENGIKIANYYLLRAEDLENEAEIYKKAKKLKYPLFVKPTKSGSSFGITKVKNGNNLIQAIKNALKYSKTVLLEENVVGRESEIAVLEQNGEIILSPIGLLEYQSDFYDYETKYKDITVKYQIPAKINTGCQKIIENYAIKIFKSLGCNTISRIDFFVTNKNKVVFNEINTMPGFTNSSMYPMLFAKKGIDFSALIDMLIK